MLMKADSHDPISIVECFLDSITMVDINIEIQYSIVHFQQFQDAKDNIVDIAKSRSLTFLGMMVATTPVYHGIS